MKKTPLFGMKHNPGLYLKGLNFFKCFAHTPDIQLEKPACTVLLYLPGKSSIWRDTLFGHLSLPVRIWIAVLLGHVSGIWHYGL